MITKNIYIIIIGFLGIISIQSCNKFLDVVPDNVPVLDQAYAKRTMAERALVTCYNGIPDYFTRENNPGYLAADEFWLPSRDNFSYNSWRIALGEQNSNSPLIDTWTGSNGGKNYWQAITRCNTFLENINKVPDMQESEIQMWEAEAKFLKAFYHFLLIKQYGPIPIMDKNVPVNLDPQSVRLARRTIDECFDYVVGLVDESMNFLMSDVSAVQQETGRVTQIAAKALKAEMLIYAASPLYNGNNDVEARLKNKDGQDLFNHTFEVSKWEKAAQACKEAIEFAEALGKKLHIWTPQVSGLQQSTINQMSLREAFNESTNNNEILWLATRYMASSDYQASFMVRRYSNEATNQGLTGFMSVPLNIVEKFYSKNGVPIEEDASYPYTSRYSIVTIPNTDAYRYNLVAGRTTAQLNLDREDRFYATLLHDGGRLYMKQVSNQSDANSYNIFMRTGEASGVSHPTNFNWTGYTSKKHYNYQNNVGASDAYTTRGYGFPIMRLANLYLYYAEALNEVNGPSEDAYAYIDKVRARSGLEGVVSSWASHARPEFKNKPSTKEGLRNIIKRERTNELALECVRFWDLLRWKDAVVELNKPITGWDIAQFSDVGYYRQKVLFTRTFLNRDYFWPISLGELRVNYNLVQAVDW
jgi:hypothetical protein